MGRRTNLRLAQSKPPPSQGFRGFDRQRQNLGLHRLRAAAHQEISLPITLLIRLRFGHLDLFHNLLRKEPAAGGKAGLIYSDFIENRSFNALATVQGEVELIAVFSGVMTYLIRFFYA